MFQKKEMKSQVWFHLIITVCKEYRISLQTNLPNLCNRKKSLQLLVDHKSIGFGIGLSENSKIFLDVSINFDL